MGTFEGHLWLPYYIKCLFFKGFRAKVKWRYEGRDFSTPPKLILDGLNIGNSALYRCWVKSIYDRENKILHFGYKKYTNKSLYRWCFQCFSFVLWEKYRYLFTMYYTRVDIWCQQLFQNFFYSILLSNFSSVVHLIHNKS